MEDGLESPIYLFSFTSRKNTKSSVPHCRSKGGWRDCWVSFHWFAFWDVLGDLVGFLWSSIALSRFYTYILYTYVLSVWPRH